MGQYKDAGSSFVFANQGPAFCTFDQSEDSEMVPDFAPGPVIEVSGLGVQTLHPPQPDV